MAIVFLASITILSGCSFISEFGVETRTVAKSNHHYKVAFQKRHYTYYISDFIPQKDQLVLSEINNIYIVDLNTGTQIKNIKIPDIGKISSTYISENDTKLYLFSTHDMQVMNTSNWTLLKQMKADEYATDTNGVSKNGDLLYFSSTIWSGTTFNKIFELKRNGGPIPTDYDFSPDNHYFLLSDHLGAILIVDVKNKEFSDIIYFKKGASQVSFRDNDSFYASYGAKLDLDKGGYPSEKLGLFAVKKKDILETFSPSSKISCWVNSPESGLLVSLYNGDIYLLNPQLDIQAKWHIDDYIRVCKQGNNGDIWLGGDKTGLYKADLAKGVISHEYKTNNPIFRLSISPDNKYLGMEELLPTERMEKVLSLD
jgi:hypothetical protein